MGFSPQQIRKLRSALRRDFIKSRVSEGQTLHYLEGWQVLAQCNRIFGFDSWNRETVLLSCISARAQGNRFTVSYLAKVRVTVKAGEDIIIREGSGMGHAKASTLGVAHENAAKAAETDATKRALATFGAPFGLTLYSIRSELNDDGKANCKAAVTGDQNSDGSALQRLSDEDRRLRPPIQADFGEQAG